MVGRGQSAAAFRPSAPTGPGRAPSRLQLIALLTGVIVVAAGIAVVSYVVKPSKARSFDLVYGSMLIDDNLGPVAVDLASGKPTVRLRNAFTAVAAKSTGDLNVVPLGGGNTLMVNPASGEFNMVDSTGFVVKTTDGGVQLPKAADATTSTAVPAGSSAYILQSGAQRTSVYLVGKSTVSSAIGASARAKARGYATVSAPLADYPSAAASGNGDLWLLTGSGDTHAITSLSVPLRSNDGATLDTHRYGAVTGVAAVGSATVGSDGTGGDVAAVASAQQVRVFRGGSTVTLPVRVDGTVLQILAASNAQGRLAFLYQTSAGWSQVSAPTSGSGGATITALRGIAAGAQLLAPAASDGRLWTMDRSGQGTLWQIDANGTSQVVAGAAQYPLLKGEKLDLSQAEVLARGNRVIFNARANYEAVVAFTDGSHAARVIDKHSAVPVDPSGATTLTNSRDDGKIDTSKPSKPTKATRPTQTVNNKIDCKTTTAIPHIPVLVPGDRGSRSIVLRWTYQTIGPDDCVPSTYIVSIKTLTADAPSAPAQLTVQGEDGVTVTGLFPATQYEVTTTAYLNGRGTSSVPVRVSTGPEGPAAPTDVRAVTTSTGDWTVSWNSCGGIAQGCVPSATWNVIPRFCDGRGLSGLPDPISSAGDPTVHSFTRTYPGSDALLGRGMCFQVQGVSPQGTAGAVSASTPVAYSWSPPVAADLQIAASQPAATTLGGSSTTSVDLTLLGDPVRAAGGVGATITFTLNGPGGAMTRTVTYDGNSAKVPVSFSGIQAGAQYTASATVSAPNHPSATASTNTVTVTTRANWPALTTSANCAPDGTIVLSCTLSVRVGGISSAASGGEQFSLDDTSQVRCGNSAFPIDRTDFDPATTVITKSVDLTAYSGTCTVSLALDEGANSRDPKVFGGTTSPTTSTSFDLPAASTLAASQSDFDVSWTGRTDALGNKIASALIKYTGSRSDDDIAKLTFGWTEVLSAPNGSTCGTNASAVTTEGITVDVSGQCLNDYGSQTGWKLAVSYRDRSTGNQRGFTFAVPGTPPNYVPPCTVAQSNFSATWNDAVPAAATTSFDPTGTALQGCSGWTYTLVNTGIQNCGSLPDGTDPTTLPGSITPTCDTSTLTLGWAIRVGYTSARDGNRTFDVPVNGSPPQTPAPNPTTP